MFCFEVRINGELKGTIGFDGAYGYGIDLSTYPAINEGLVVIEADGSVETSNEYHDELKWFKSSVKLDDIVTIQVVEKNIADEPTVTKFNEGMIEKCVSPKICSNCGKPQFETEKFIAALKISLCFECAKAIAEIISES